jgi:Cof subfamily protein (haloacid dehalogenase superfamily)
MKQTIKQIVLDIDGTLLNSNRVISPKTKQVLCDAQRQGVRVVLASGRPTRGMLHLAQELDMHKYNGFLVSYNGARLTDVDTNEILFDQPLPQELAQAALERLKDYNLIPMINDDEHMYVHDVYAGVIDVYGKQTNIIQYEAHGNNFLLQEVQDLAKFATFGLNKILIAGDPQYLKQVADEVYQPFVETLNGVFSAPFYFELTDKGIDKAKALDVVNAKLGIQPQQIIAFGDAQNDLSIIQYAGIGVAMGNASEIVKSAANHITASNDQDGIAVALDKFL